MLCHHVGDHWLVTRFSWHASTSDELRGTFKACPICTGLWHAAMHTLVCHCRSGPEPSVGRIEADRPVNSFDTSHLLWLFTHNLLPFSSVGYLFRLGNAISPLPKYARRAARNFAPARPVSVTRRTVPRAGNVQHIGQGCQDVT
jgi:hypothetical protein